MSDDVIFPNVDTFNGRRFYDVKQQIGQGNKHQSVSPSDTEANFGTGPRACLGRFLVRYEIPWSVDGASYYSTKPGAEVYFRRKNKVLGGCEVSYTRDSFSKWLEVLGERMLQAYGERAIHQARRMREASQHI
ncbi:Uu.00g113620.m01.CDS01 [Anthostomella pinea]|uniref:Uu.00g113620.m01.CDS01 n=1 Tax=Anthostomella pinea TaxID=933095 RepID=A0AAI8VFE3_9PEZI|nr:Uu.00g113620.m01.CDS01 [Anthostomella pinea]